VEINWTALRTLATETAGRAHAPYSRLRVGAAGQVSDGRVLAGCNVENASFGLTLCAECGLVSALHASGGGTIVAVSVRTPDGRSLLPCGRCRQVLLEAGGPGLLVDTGSGPVELDRLLPSAFTVADLPGSGARLPGSGARMPGSGARLPGSGAGLPGSGDDLPSSRADLPDFRSDLPGPGDD